MSKCDENKPGYAINRKDEDEWYGLIWSTSKWAAGLCYNLVAKYWISYRMTYNPRNRIKQSSQSQSTLLEVHVKTAWTRTPNEIALSIDHILWKVSQRKVFFVLKSMRFFIRSQSPPVFSGNNMAPKSKSQRNSKLQRLVLYSIVIELRVRFCLDFRAGIFVLIIQYCNNVTS